MSDESASRDTPYGVAIHEAAHSVIATMFGVPWHAVFARKSHGSLLPDKDAWLDLMRTDPDGSRPMELFAMISVAGPIADARWHLNLGDLDRRTGSWFENLEMWYGGGVDIPTARMWADESETTYEKLADDVITILTTDKIWLAVQRVADRLIEKGTLITTDVNELVYGNVRGAQ